MTQAVNAALAGRWRGRKRDPQAAAESTHHDVWPHTTLVLAVAELERERDEDHIVTRGRCTLHRAAVRWI